MLRLGALSLAASVSAHYVLQVPAGIGYDDVKIVEGPCGGFDGKTRTTVSEWPVGGGNVGVLTTHPSGSWELNAALVESGDLKFVPLVNTFQQTAGLGGLCFSNIPGFEAWIGKDVVLQAVNHASDGSLYQCAAIKFVAGGAQSPPAECINSPSAKFGPIVPASPPSGGGGGGGGSTSGGGSGSTQPPPTSTTTRGGGGGGAPSSSTSASSSGAPKPTTTSGGGHDHGSHDHGASTTSSKSSGAASPTGAIPTKPSGGVVTAGAADALINRAVALAGGLGVAVAILL